MKFAAGGIEGGLLLLRSVVDEGTAVFADDMGQVAFDGSLSERRIVVQIADDLAAQEPDMIHVSLNGFGSEAGRGGDSRKGRKQTSRRWPGGRSSSSPIQERGHASRSRQ